MTVNEIKSEILKEYAKFLKIPVSDFTLSPDDYLLKVFGLDIYLEKDKQQLSLYPFNFIINNYLYFIIKFSKYKIISSLT